MNYGLCTNAYLIIGPFVGVLVVYQINKSVEENLAHEELFDY